MKKKFKNQKVWALALLVAFGVSATSCSDDDSVKPAAVNTKNPMITATLKQYVDNVVVPTYKSLADNALKLQKATEDLSTDGKIKAAGDAWKKARENWEQSEAFLFGAAADYNIDPHIDSWPLDKSQLDNLLANTGIMEKFDADYAKDNLGGGLLGFHAIEYVLFKDGKAKPLAEVTSEQAKFAAGVAEDLARQAIRLEASWAGTVKEEKQKILEESELEPTNNYGEILKGAGEGNPKYKTQKEGIVEILNGAIAIADEVGNAKITDPVESGNVLDVESWYSWNSLEDFKNNIRSIQNAYFGKVGATKAETNSVSSYIKSKNTNLDDEIQKAITNAIKEIGNIGYPFRNNLTKEKTNKAIVACQTLQAKLEAAVTTVNK